MMVATPGTCGMGEGEYNPYTGSYGSDPAATPDYSGYATVQPVYDLLPGTYTTSGGRQIQFGGGSSDALARLLAPVVPGVLNLVTAMYSPPAYETVTGPGGSRTTIRVPGTVAGQPAQVVAGMSTNTLMMIGIAVAAMALFMGRR